MPLKKPKPPTQLVLTDITVDPRLIVREVDERIAEDYAEHIDTLPPIVVWDIEGQYAVVDGRHRLRAHQLAGAEFIRVIVLGGTLDEAKLYLAQCDARVGLRRSRAAKRIAIRLVLGTQAASTWSDRKIATYTGTSHTLVAQVRAELARKPEDRESAPGKIATAVAVETVSTDGDPAVDQGIPDAAPRPDAGVSSGAASTEGGASTEPLTGVLAAITTALNRFSTDAMREEAIGGLIAGLNVMLGKLREQRHGKI